MSQLLRACASVRNLSKLAAMRKDRCNREHSVKKMACERAARLLDGIDSTIEAQRRQLSSLSIPGVYTKDDYAKIRGREAQFMSELATLTLERETLKHDRDVANEALQTHEVRLASVLRRHRKVMDAEKRVRAQAARAVERCEFEEMLEVHGHDGCKKA